MTGDASAVATWIEDRLAVGPVAVICHRNGDLDTVSSAVALARTYGGSMRACGVHVSRPAKALLSALGETLQPLDASGVRLPRALAGLIIVDTASPEQVGFRLPEGVPKAIIDHHGSGSDWSLETDDVQWIAPRGSTAEMVADVLAARDAPPLDDVTRRLLLAGIQADTGRFRHAGAASLRAAADLLEGSEINWPAFLESMERIPLDRSQRVAIARGLARVEPRDAGPWYVLTSRAGSQEGRLASLMLGAGADVAIVRKRLPEGGTRLTGRCTAEAREGGLDLGTLMHGLVGTLGGEGGGHAGAAGWSGPADPIQAESAALAALSATSRGA